MPEDLLEEFENTVQIYVLRCLTGKFSRGVFKDFDEIDVDVLRGCRTNVTPNGALVPKRGNISNMYIAAFDEMV